MLLCRSDVLTCFTLLLIVSATSSSPCAPRSTSLDISGNTYSLIGLDPTALCPVHDPSIAQENATSFFVFSTDRGPNPPHLQVRASHDGGISWAYQGGVFDQLPLWAESAVPGVTSIWAPDAIIFRNEWRIYYALSTFGSQRSAIGLVTTSSLTNPIWIDKGLVLQSSSSDPFNAIDPSVIIDENDLQWLVFGSFWGGIYAARLNSTTGMLLYDLASSPLQQLQHLAQRPAPDALERPFALRHLNATYLFASFDKCCQGNKSSYNVRFGHATNITSPFTDFENIPLLSGGGSKIISGGFGYAAGGGQSLLRTEANKEITRMILHAYDGVSGDPWMQIINFSWKV